MIQFEKVTKSFGEHTIFSDVTFKIENGEKIGIVGKNGAGKSTLVKIMTGEEEFDSGTIGGLRKEDIGYSEQMPNFTKATLLEEILHDDIEEYRAKKILFGLGFTEPETEKNPQNFSGGEKAKVSLAKALIDEPRILILDEPTNHLDIYAIDFLEDFVKNYRGTVIAVTHDRHFLQNCVDKILDIEKGKATLYPGNYDKYFRLKKERREYELKAYEKQQEEIARTEEFIRRNKAGVKSKQARGRQKILDRLERLEKPPSDDSVNLKLNEVTESANRVLNLENINFKGIIKNFSAEILKSEKVGLIGKNGTGKSTLLKIITGELKADSGEIKIGNRVKIGYLSQGHEELNPDLTPIEELENEFDLTRERARAELAKLDIGAELAENLISEMSGGEKTRVALAKLILTGANFLILDEPTNHLDLPACEAIENALKNFDGTILLVTHDRRLLETVTDRTIEFEKKLPEKILPAKKISPEQKNFSKSPSQKTKSGLKSEINVEKLEAQIKMAEMELKMIEREINGEILPDKLAELAAAHAEKLKEIDEFYERWGELA